MNGFKYNCSIATKDCNNEENGTAYLDNCNQCVGGSTGKLACEKVQVTFNLDMVGVNHAQSAYITGTMTATNGNWQLMPMQYLGGDQFTYSQEFYPGDTMAYYFLNANDWNARETVPLPCVVYWQDRGLTVPYQDTIVNHAWAACSHIVTGLNRGR